MLSNRPARRGFAILPDLGPVLAGLLAVLPLAAAGSAAQPGVFTFRSYGTEDGLSNLGIYAIAQDAEGYLWTGTDDGLYRYDGHRFRVGGTGLKGGPVWDVATGPDRGLWVSTDDGAYRLEGSALLPVEGLPRQRPAFLALGPGDRAIAALGSQLFSRNGPGPMAPLKTMPGQISHGWASRDLDTLLIATDTELWRLQAGAWDHIELPKPPGTSIRVFQDSRGHIYLRSRTSVWRRAGWVGAWSDLSRALPGNAFNAYPPVEDAMGRVWVGTSRGLACLDGDRAWILDEAKGLPGGWAGPVMLDREGSLWAGSEGLQKLKGRFLWTNFGIHQGLPSPDVWDIGRSLDGQMFACTEHGVATLQGERWTVVPGTEGRTYIAGGGDGRNALWFGGEGRGTLTRLDLRTHRTEQVATPPCKPTDVVLAISKDGGEGVYLATRNEGVFHVHRGGSGWVTEPMPFPEMHTQERVNSVRWTATGQLWAAGEHGLFVFDQGRWTRLGPADGLLGENCASLAKDPKGFIWVTYLDARGISRLARDKGAWRAVESLTQPQALFNEAISSIIFEPTGVLWMGTGGGMKRWDGQHLDVFNRGDGLSSLDPSPNSITYDVDGGIWQGFSNGLSYFQPRAWRGSPRPPTARIQEITDGRRAHDLGESVPRIPYADHTLTFHFSALSFLNEARVLHEVRLVGLENEWRSTPINEARYPALPAGAYRFEVRSRFQEGQPGQADGFSFRILPPWWGTWWFRLATLLAAAGAVFLGFRRRTAQLHRRNADLEAMVAHRTEALEASKAQLETANKALEEATLVDPLTGLHNRRFLDLSLPTDTLQAQRAFRELVNAGQDPLEPKEDILLFLMDIDHFKTVNDSFGHQAGDLVLKQLSRVLQSTTRASDSLVRWGGEEFLLVARRTRRSGAPAIARNLLDAMRSQTFSLPGGVELRKTWSVGFTALPLHPRHPELGDWQQAIKIADQCLYAAKNSGRDRFVGALMDPEADPSALADLKNWDVSWALERGLMTLISSEPGFTWID